MQDILVRASSESPPNLSLLKFLTVLPRAFTLCFEMSNDPVLFAYAVKRSAKTKKPIWTRIGKAYPHEVGAGLTVVLDMMPMDGRIVLLELDDADDARLLGEAARFRAKPGKSGKPS